MSVLYHYFLPVAASADNRQLAYPASHALTSVYYTEYKYEYLKPAGPSLELSQIYGKELNV